MRKFLWMLCSILFTHTLTAQDFSNKGKDFYLCFPQHVQSGTSYATLSIWITSDKPSSGTVTMGNGAFSATFNIAANGIQEIQVPYSAAHISNAESNTVIRKSIRVRVDAGKAPVVAYAQQWGAARSAASLLLPVNVLGKKYYAISFTQNGSNSGQIVARSQFQIVAVANNTLITITPRKNGVLQTPVNVSLPLAGDVYQYQSTDPNANSQDLSGTFIESIASGTGSCLPIAVFSGSSNLSIGTTTCSATSYDPIFQQLYPVSTWGKNFGFIPFADYPNGNPYRVLASENNTNLFFNGALVATLNAGEIYPAAFTSNPVLLNVPTSITADKPICVTQYSQSAACARPGGGNLGDPDMVVLNPIEQNIADITIFSTRQQAITRQWVNVLMPTAKTGSFRIGRNGAAGVLPNSAWTAFPAMPGYSFLSELLPSPSSTSDSYRLYADTGFNAICYGFGNVESYAYSAGTNVRDQNQEVGTVSEYGIETSPSVCVGSPFKFKIRLPYQPDSIYWNLDPLFPSQWTLPISPATSLAFDSTTTFNGKPMWWYSLPAYYSYNIPGSYGLTIQTYNQSTEGCGNQQDIPFFLDVSGPPTADIAFTQAACPAIPVTFTDISTTDKPTYHWWWDFNDAGSGANNISSLQNPVHTFSAPGSYQVRFASITRAGCLSDTITRTVVVGTLPTATATGDASYCLNATADPVTFTAANGTGPYIFTYKIDNGAPQTITSTGNSASIIPPTTTGGIFKYILLSVSNQATPQCMQLQPDTVTIVVNVSATITLSSAPATDNQQVCSGLPITNITYAIAGSGNGATVTGLPAGVNTVFNAGILTISGSSVVPGIYNYSVQTTGNCILPSANGSIVIRPDASLALLSAPGSDNQQACINVAIPLISYSFGGGATNVSATNLPPGITGTIVGNNFQVSGTPITPGTYNYTVATTGTCVQRTLNGVIIVKPNSSLTLSSPSASSTGCINNTITPITYTIAGSATGGIVASLPQGVTGTFANGVITIAGTLSVSGTFNYTVTPTGDCAAIPATGVIVVTPDPTLQLNSLPATSNQEVCPGIAITPIVYLASSPATINVTGLPTGIAAVNNAGTITISGNAVTPGTYNYSIVLTATCGQLTRTGTITVNAAPTVAFNVNGPACMERSTLFADASTPNSGTINNWQWNFGDPSGSQNTSTLQNPSHLYTNSGIYQVTLNVTTDKGCVGIPITRPVTVNKRPNAGFILPEVCLLDPFAQFTDTSRMEAPGTITAWSWNFGDPASGANNTSTAQNAIHTYSTATSFNVQLVATSNVGCTDTVRSQLMVNGGNPVADALVLNAASLCVKDSVAVQNKSSITQGIITKLEIYWDNSGAPTVFETDQTPVFDRVYRHKYPTFNSPASRNYSIRVRAFSGNVCVSEKIIPVTVYAQPALQFNLLPDVCYDAPAFQITQATEINGLPGTVRFSGPGVSNTGLFNPALAGIGTHTIWFKFITNPALCVDSLSRTIVVRDTATSVFTHRNTTCFGTPVSFTDNSTAPTGVLLTSTVWDFGDGTAPETHPAGATFTHNFPAIQSYTVRMYNMSSNGCRSTTSTQVITIRPLPMPAFSFNETSVCLPAAAVSFTNNAGIADGTVNTLTYAWNFGDPASGTLNTSTARNPAAHIFRSAGPFVVRLDVRSQYGCIASANQTVDFIHPRPTADFTINKTGVCIGEPFNFTSSSNPADGSIVSWHWNFGNGTPGSTATVANPTFIYTNPGAYAVQHYIVNSFGCHSDTIPKTVNVYAFPVVNAGEDKIVLEGGSVTLEPVVTGDDLQYLWTQNVYLDNNRIKNPTTTPPSDITYTLTVTGRGGCVGRTDQVLVKVLPDLVIPNTFSPNNDGINDKWVISYLDTYPNNKVQIFTRNGQLVFESRGYRTPWDGNIGTKSLPVDTYYYIIEPGSGRKPVTGYVTIIK